MATSSRSHEDIADATKSANNVHVLIWLDDSAEEDPGLKEIFGALFDNVFIFTNPEACLELVKSMNIKIPCLSILISGRYGQILVRDHLQPLNQVKDIYVFCQDITKHGRWAQTCDKVRCVFSDITKIIQHMQYEIQNTQEQSQHDDEPLHCQLAEPKVRQRERFIDDNNLFDHLALKLLLQSSDEGIEDFSNYCQTHNKHNDPTHHDVDDQDRPEVREQQQYFKLEQPIKEWYRSDLFFTKIHSNDLTKLWTFRWFIRQFHRQLSNEQENFIRDKTKITIYHGTWLSTDELDAMKHRMGQIMIITESLLTSTNRQVAFNRLQNTEENKHKILFEINVDTTTRGTVPYAELNNEEVLLWFGARCHLIKLEYIEQPDPYWSISFNLCSTIDLKSSIQTLYEYYYKELTELNDLHHAFGRLFIYKGFYIQAEKWLQTSHHYHELAELAIRQGHYEQAKQNLEHFPEDCQDANLLRAYLNLLTTSDDFSKVRLILLRIFAQATDKLVRARANIAFGYMNLILTQQIDQALEYFTLGSEVLRTVLPEIHPDIAKSYIGLGYTYYVQRNLTEARKYFQMAFNIQKQSLTYDHPDFAKTRNGFAHCLSTEKRTIQQALDECEYALDILLESYPYEQQHHPEIMATRDDMERLKKRKELHARHTLLDYV